MCQPYTSSESEDGDVSFSAAWQLKKDGTCVQCNGPKGASEQCLECNPNYSYACSKCMVGAVPRQNNCVNGVLPAAASVAAASWRPRKHPRIAAVLLPTLQPNPHAQERDEMDRGLYLTKTAGCAVCPGADKECARCASGSGRCLACYNFNTHKPSGGASCVPKATCQQGKKGCLQCKNNK